MPPHDPPPGDERPGQEPAAEEPLCPRCGAPHDPLQEYCLECGLRLVPLPRERYIRTTVWSRESPVWLWLALGALLLVALAAGAIVALAATDDEKDAGAGASSETTGVIPTLPTSTITIETITTPSTLTLPTTTGSTTTTTTGLTTTTATTTGSTTTNANTTISWPSGKNGYTVVLMSTPTSQGRGPAEAAADDAIDAGLTQVGILNSSDYSSLNPGYYVTFAGVYDTQSQAESALPNARSKGFSTAYVRRVAN